MSEWFPVNVAFSRGCVMSPWLFYVYTDGDCKGPWERAGVAKFEWWQVLDKPGVICR